MRELVRAFCFAAPAECSAGLDRGFLVDCRVLQPTGISMRYKAKFQNGVWKLFDSHTYTDIDTFDTQKAAELAADRANARRR